MAYPDEQDGRAEISHWKQVNETIAGLFIGPMEGRLEVERLAIDLVIPILSKAERDDPEYRKDLGAAVVDLSGYDVDDDADGLTLAMLVDIVSKIHGALEAAQHVLVHCGYGKSRSAIAIMAYFIASGKERTCTDALMRLRKYRPCVKPNPGFLDLLANHETDLYQSLTKGDE
jgi:predicted protein tyrosine phosphatase